MEIVNTRLDGVRLIKPDLSFEDYRGVIFEHYNLVDYIQLDGVGLFLQDTISISYHGVIRGLHGDDRTVKLVSCLKGRIYAVVVNYIEGHQQFLEWESFILTGENRLQLLVPSRFGNGYQVLSDEAIYHYRLSVRYGGQDKQFSLNPLDPKLGIPWPIGNPILSKRDRGASWIT